MAEQLDGVDEFHACVIAALDRKTEQCTGPLGANALNSIKGRGALEPCVGHALDPIVGLQPICNLFGVCHMLLHAERQ